MADKTSEPESNGPERAGEERSGSTGGVPETSPVSAGERDEIEDVSSVQPQNKPELNGKKNTDEASLEYVYGLYGGKVYFIAAIIFAVAVSIVDGRYFGGALATPILLLAVVGVVAIGLRMRMRK